jgi:hypothetical protein
MLDTPGLMEFPPQSFWWDDWGYRVDLETCAVCTIGTPEVHLQVLTCAKWGHIFTFMGGGYTMFAGERRSDGLIKKERLPAPFNAAVASGPSAEYMRLVKLEDPAISKQLF